MVFRTTPQLGPQLDEVFTGLPYWDGALGIQNADTGVEPSYKLNNVEIGDDGALYVWVQAGAAIDAATNGTQLVVSAAGQATAGSGGWYAPPAGVADNAYFHARNKAWNVF